VAGLIPGLMMGGALLVVSGWISWRRGYASHTDIKLKHMLTTGVRAFPALMIPVIILGGILSGITTVTEAAGLGAIYALVIGAFGYRNLTLRDIVDALVSTVKFSGVVFFLLGASTILGWYVVRSGIAQSAAEFISMVSTVPIIQIFVVNVLLIIIGMFVDVLPAIVIAAPALAPAMVQLGFDPLHFAVVMLLALNLGNITPPVGMTLMVASKIAGVTYESAFRQSIPFIFGHLVVLAIASVFPQLILWLPNLVKNIF
jgi:tripartite ATP-independent transporter DctM subunit